MDKLNELAFEEAYKYYSVYSTDLIPVFNGDVRVERTVQYVGPDTLAKFLLPYLRQAWRMSREDILALAYDHYWNSLIKEKDLILCHLRSIMGMATTQDFATSKLADKMGERFKPGSKATMVAAEEYNQMCDKYESQLAAKDAEIAELKAENEKLNRMIAGLSIEDVGVEVLKKYREEIVG